MKNSANMPEVIDEILENYDFEDRNNSDDNIVNNNEHPAAIIVVTDSRKYKENQKNKKNI